MGDGDSGARDAVLVEPARQQVIGLASDLLGTLKADDVPAPLRAIARFAPAKRRRLGAVPLAAVLDRDADFRGRLAEVLEQTSPELVAAVRDGSGTGAADPVDVAVVAYLTRPPGWERVLERANERWSAERAAGASTGDELDRLRRELQQARTEARGEGARVRTAVEVAVAERDAELAALRRTVRERTRELRAAERERDEALAAAEQARLRADRGEAGKDAEVRRLRARVAELERAGASARRGSRVEREVDDARLWLLVDTLVQAAAGVRRELSLPAPTVRPADAVALDAGQGSDGGRSVRDAPALDALLALPHAHLVVDGYNVTKTGYGDLSLEQQRTRLIASLAPLAAQSGAEITIAFDGSTRPPVQPGTPRGLRVLFSAAGEIADDLIRRLVAAEPAGRVVVVATSDGEVVRDVRAGGAWSVPSAVLLQRLV